MLMAQLMVPALLDSPPMFDCGIVALEPEGRPGLTYVTFACDCDGLHWRAASRIRMLTRCDDHALRLVERARCAGEVHTWRATEHRTYTTRACTRCPATDLIEHGD